MGHRKGARITSGVQSLWSRQDASRLDGRQRRPAALLHEYPLRVGRRGPHFSGPSAGVTLQG